MPKLTTIPRRPALTDERRAVIEALSRETAIGYYLAPEPWGEESPSRLAALRQLLAQAAEQTPLEAGTVAAANLAWWQRWLAR